VLIAGSLQHQQMVRAQKLCSAWATQRGYNRAILVFIYFDFCWDLNKVPRLLFS
jgi:hypothetical protein